MEETDRETKRQQFQILKAQLDAEQSSFLSHWRDLADFIFPRRPRFTVSDVNKGDRRNQKIYDSTATLAARTLRSGMMSGVTSPARPWFRLTTPDPDLAEYGSVKEWLHHVSQNMSTAFLKSNLYNCLPITYGDMGAFATGCMSIEEDFQDIVRFYPFPIGSYKIANNEKMKVDVFMRDFRMTVRQLINKFGPMEMNSREIDWSRFSEQVKQFWDRGEYETWIDVTHVIKPNPDYDPKKIQSKFKKYLSCYYEQGYSGGNGSGAELLPQDFDRYLSEKGYDMFPILAPRWEVTGEDVYGTECPGMTALGDIKQLQVQEKRIAQAIEKMVNPPMTGPTSLRNSKASILPADITYVDIREGQQGFRPAHEVNFRVSELEGKQAQIRQRISRAFYEDLFLMLANSDRREITAREIEERHEEKLLALGPVLEQLNQDLLDPLIDNTFNIMLRQNRLPPPPKEIQGMDLKVEYISVMAQAQKVVGIGGVERFASFVGSIAAANPEVMDKVDMDQMVDVYGDLTSVPPSIVRTDEMVAGIRQNRANAQKQAKAAELIQQGAGAAKDLSQSNLSEDNALGALLAQGNAGRIV